jgi:hypothetical protein
LNRSRRERDRLVDPAVIAVVQFHYRIARPKLVPRRGDDHDPDGGVHRLVDAISTSPESHRGAADELGIEAGQETGPIRREHVAPRRRREQAIVVHNAGIAVLLLDDAPEALEAASGGDGEARLVFAVGHVLGDPAKDEHPAG